MNLDRKNRWQTLLETAAVFILFAAYGWDFAPGINESHYLTKAKHFWDSNWCQHDLFVASQDAHVVYFSSIGWLCNFFELATVAWIGRIVGWMLLAYAWVRMSNAVCRSIGFSIASSWVFAALCLHVPMAGEWVIGGIEGKVISFSFVFLAIANAIEKRNYLCWIYCGAAVAFHAVVGVWATIGLLFARVFELKTKRPCKTELGGLLIGIFLALGGIIPGLMLTGELPDEGAETAVGAQVTMRLSHHLLISEFGVRAVLTFFIASIAWLLLLQRSANEKLNVVHRFVFAMLTITVAGAVLNWLMSFESFEYTAGKLLRFYWFRMSDIAIPMVLAFQLVELFGRNMKWNVLSFVISGLLALVLIADVVHRNYAIVTDGRPGADRQSLPTYFGDERRTYETWKNWKKVCDWVRENTDRDAVFITPRQQQTFNWYANRAEVANWKNAPQDAEGIIEWYRRMEACYAGWNEQSGLLWQYNENNGKFEARDEELLTLANRFGARYLVVPQRHIDLRNANGLPVKFKRVYPKDPDMRETYAVFDLEPGE